MIKLVLGIKYRYTLLFRVLKGSLKNQVNRQLVAENAYKFRAGSFSEDSRGRWYFNVCVEVESQATTATSAIGIDLGLKDYATPSEGEKLEAGKFYRNLETALGKAQRANKKARVRAIHAKIKNRRKDALHKFSTALVNSHAAIFVGDVSSKKLVKTSMAKSVLDEGMVHAQDTTEI